jgi:hypothetical protein
MGVYVDYSFHAECTDDELLDRLRQLRRKLKKLPLARLGKIKRLDPVYQGLHLHALREQGYKFPAAVNARLRGKYSRSYRIQCGLAAPPTHLHVPRELQLQCLKPAHEFVQTTDLWNSADLPEKVEFGQLTIFRGAFAFALADVMLRYGYLMILDPGEGSETVNIGLTTLRREGAAVPMWLGSSFTKTQYADHFTTVHETVCRVLDAAQEVGLLYQARDTCGFYEHRNWKKAAPIVNAETTFAHVVGGLLSLAVESAREAGMPIQDISNPATKNYNIIRVHGEPEPE